MDVADLIKEEHSYASFHPREERLKVDEHLIDKELPVVADQPEESDKALNIASENILQNAKNKSDLFVTTIVDHPNIEKNQDEETPLNIFNNIAEDSNDLITEKIIGYSKHSPVGTKPSINMRHLINIKTIKASPKVVELEKSVLKVSETDNNVMNEVIQIASEENNKVPANIIEQGSDQALNDSQNENIFGVLKSTTKSNKISTKACDPDKPGQGFIVNHNEIGLKDTSNNPQVDQVHSTARSSELCKCGGNIFKTDVISFKVSNQGIERVVCDKTKTKSLPSYTTISSCSCPVVPGAENVHINREDKETEELGRSDKSENKKDEVGIRIKKKVDYFINEVESSIKNVTLKQNEKEVKVIRTGSYQLETTPRREAMKSVCKENSEERKHFKKMVIKSKSKIIPGFKITVSEDGKPCIERFVLELPNQEQGSVKTDKEHFRKFSGCEEVACLGKGIQIMKLKNLNQKIFSNLTEICNESAKNTSESCSAGTDNRKNVFSKRNDIDAEVTTLMSSLLFHATKNCPAGTDSRKKVFCEDEKIDTDITKLMNFLLSQYISGKKLDTTFAADKAIITEIESDEKRQEINTISQTDNMNNVDCNRNEKQMNKETSNDITSTNSVNFEFVKDKKNHIHETSDLNTAIVKEKDLEIESDEKEQEINTISQTDNMNNVDCNRNRKQLNKETSNDISSTNSVNFEFVKDKKNHIHETSDLNTAIVKEKDLEIESDEKEQEINTISQTDNMNNVDCKKNEKQMNKETSNDITSTNSVNFEFVKDKKNHIHEPSDLNTALVKEKDLEIESDEKEQEINTISQTDNMNNVDCNRNEKQLNKEISNDISSTNLVNFEFVKDKKNHIHETSDLNTAIVKEKDLEIESDEKEQEINTISQTDNMNNVDCNKNEQQINKETSNDITSTNLVNFEFVTDKKNHIHETSDLNTAIVKEKDLEIDSDEKEQEINTISQTDNMNNVDCNKNEKQMNKETSNDISSTNSVNFEFVKDKKNHIHETSDLNTAILKVCEKKGNDESSDIECTMLEVEESNKPNLSSPNPTSKSLGEEPEQKALSDKQDGLIKLKEKSSSDTMEYEKQESSKSFNVCSDVKKLSIFKHQELEESEEKNSDATSSAVEISSDSEIECIYDELQNNKESCTNDKPCFDSMETHKFLNNVCTSKMGDELQLNEMPESLKVNYGNNFSDELKFWNENIVRETVSVQHEPEKNVSNNEGKHENDQQVLFGITNLCSSNDGESKSNEEKLAQVQQITTEKHLSSSTERIMSLQTKEIECITLDDDPENGEFNDNSESLADVNKAVTNICNLDKEKLRDMENYKYNSSEGVQIPNKKVPCYDEEFFHGTQTKEKNKINNAHTEFDNHVMHNTADFKVDEYSLVENSKMTFIESNEVNRKSEKSSDKINVLEKLGTVCITLDDADEPDSNSEIHCIINKSVDNELNASHNLGRITQYSKTDPRNQIHLNVCHSKSSDETETSNTDIIADFIASQDVKGRKELDLSDMKLNNEEPTESHTLNMKSLENIIIDEQQNFSNKKRLSSEKENIVGMIVQVSNDVSKEDCSLNERLTENVLHSKENNFKDVQTIKEMVEEIQATVEQEIIEQERKSEYNGNVNADSKSIDKNLNDDCIESTCNYIISYVTNKVNLEVNNSKEMKNVKTNVCVSNLKEIALESSIQEPSKESAQHCMWKNMGCKISGTTEEQQKVLDVEHVKTVHNQDSLLINCKNMKQACIQIKKLTNKDIAAYPCAAEHLAEVIDEVSQNNNEENKSSISSISENQRCLRVRKSETKVVKRDKKNKCSKKTSFRTKFLNTVETDLHSTETVLKGGDDIIHQCNVTIEESCETIPDANEEPENIIKHLEESPNKSNNLLSEENLEESPSKSRNLHTKRQNTFIDGHTPDQTKSLVSKSREITQIINSEIGERKKNTEQRIKKSKKGNKNIHSFVERKATTSKKRTLSVDESKNSVKNVAHSEGSSPIGKKRAISLSDGKDKMDIINICKKKLKTSFSSTDTFQENKASAAVCKVPVKRKKHGKDSQRFALLEAEPALFSQPDIMVKVDSSRNKEKKPKTDLIVNVPTSSSEKRKFTKNQNSLPDLISFSNLKKYVNNESKTFKDNVDSENSNKTPRIDQIHVDGKSDHVCHEHSSLKACYILAKEDEKYLGKEKNCVSPITDSPSALKNQILLLSEDETENATESIMESPNSAFDISKSNLKFSDLNMESNIEAFSSAPSTIEENQSQGRKSIRLLKKKNQSFCASENTEKKVLTKKESENSPKGDGNKKRKRRNSDSEEEDPDKLWCICRKPHNNRFMIQCDSCKEWYHGSCVGINRSLGLRLEKEKKEWRCPVCSQRMADLEEMNCNESEPVILENKNEDNQPIESIEECILDSVPFPTPHLKSQTVSLMGHSIPQGIPGKNTDSTYSVVEKSTNEAEIQAYSNDCKNLVKTSSDVNRINSNKCELKTSLKSQPSMSKSQQSTSKSQPSTSKSQPSTSKSQPSTSKNQPSTSENQPSTSAAMVEKDVKTASLNEASSASKMVDKASKNKAAIKPSKRCMACSNPALRHSCYCCDECIENHVAYVIEALRTTKGLKGLELDNHKLILYERSKGHVVAGEKAPSVREAAKWLKSHKNYAIACKNYSINVRKESAVSKKDAESVESKKSCPKLVEPRIRSSVRRSLKNTLVDRCEKSDDFKRSEDFVHKRAMKIESELYAILKEDQSKYCTKYRSLLYNIGDLKNHGLFRRVLEEIPPEDLVRMSAAQLASEELAQWREKEAQHCLDIIKRVNLEQQKFGSSSVLKKTHKGEVEIEDDLISIDEGIPKMEEKICRDESLKNESLEKPKAKDTTQDHRSHLFCQNCRICLGIEQPPALNKGTSKTVRVAHTITLDSTPPATSSKSSVKTSSKIAVPKSSVLKCKEDSKDQGPISTLTIESQQTHSMTKKTKVVSSVWKGFIRMLDVAKFLTTAYKVSGNTVHLQEDIPDIIEVCGRISPDQVWEYLSKIKQAGNKELVVIRFKPANEEEFATYDSFYKYLSSRKRFGVSSSYSKRIKDFYILPLAATRPVPNVLLPFDGPGLPSNKPNLLLGVIVKHKVKQSISTSKVSKSDYRKQVDCYTPPPVNRSYTPPLPSSNEVYTKKDSPAYGNVSSSHVTVEDECPFDSQMSSSNISASTCEPSYTPPLKQFVSKLLDDEKPYDPGQDILNLVPEKREADTNLDSLVNSDNSEDLEKINSLKRDCIEIIENIKSYQKLASHKSDTEGLSPSAETLDISSVTQSEMTSFLNMSADFPELISDALKPSNAETKEIKDDLQINDLFSGRLNNVLDTSSESSSKQTPDKTHQEKSDFEEKCNSQGATPPADDDEVAAIDKSSDPRIKLRTYFDDGSFSSESNNVSLSHMSASDLLECAQKQLSETNDSTLIFSQKEVSSQDLEDVNSFFSEDDYFANTWNNQEPPPPGLETKSSSLNDNAYMEDFTQTQISNNSVQSNYNMLDLTLETELKKFPLSPMLPEVPPPLPSSYQTYIPQGFNVQTPPPNFKNFPPPICTSFPRPPPPPPPLIPPMLVSPLPEQSQSHFIEESWSSWQVSGPLNQDVNWHDQVNYDWEHRFESGYSNTSLQSCNSERSEQHADEHSYNAQTFSDNNWNMQPPRMNRGNWQKYPSRGNRWESQKQGRHAFPYHKNFMK
ncbi:uncharacterized protein LOC129219046 [Uloborus diversus]|uniref:uncharacterized protein LOC129219046 n=1 Tax=Uloborus diversus TaxID=327109 RepID=UPI00240A279B|nr:uncharacterized protein LOC129219046 [Uloborus diversus]